MKIGLDLDDVTVNFLDSLLFFYHEKTGNLLNKDNFKTYNLWESGIGKDREEAIKITHEFHESRHFDEIKPIESAIESVNTLLDNNEIIVITSRPAPWKEKTEKWVKKYLSKIDPQVIYSGDFHNQGKTKAELCEENKVKIMIEDSGEYALNCAKRGIFVVLFDQPWNHGVNHEKIVRVWNWKEALEAINVLETKLNN